MKKRPKYDRVLIVANSSIAIIAAWALAWNMILFNMPIDVWGFFLGVMGIVSFGITLTHIVETYKKRKYFVWETLKNG